MAIAKLSIDIEARLANIEQNVNRAVQVFQNGGQHISAVFRGLLAPIAAATSVTGAFYKTLESQRQFDVLNAGLQTATGSATNAGEAFGVLQQFAARTPYDLAQVTEGFTKLVNLGLTPSERALTSYGNTASAMGKNLNQMIEAVADAATGEFERLKEFGIKASAEGDKVAFTFRGVTTTVANNAAAIEGYLLGIGETDFGGAMAKRMDSLDGMLSNLGDEWDRLFLNISQKGVGSVIRDGVQVAIDVLGELNAMFASGEMTAYIDAFTGKFAGLGEDISAAIEVATDVLGDFKEEGSAAVKFVTDAFRNMPENVRAFVGIMAVQVAAGLDGIKAYATAFKDGVKAIFTSDTTDAVAARLKESLERINESREESISGILAEREAAIASADAQIAKGKALREWYDEDQKAERGGVDALAKYKIDATGKLNAAQAKMLEEFRREEQKRSLSATDLALADAEATAARKRAQAGNNAELLRLIEEDLARQVAEIKAKDVATRAALETRLTEATKTEAGRRLDTERNAAGAVMQVWSQANAVRAAQTGGAIRNQGTSGEFVSSWDDNGNYVGNLGKFQLDGFATGGSFLVGGSGGTDSQIVAFRASPDERVTIETPEQQRSNGGGVTINIHGSSLTPGQLLSMIKQAMRVEPNLFGNGMARAG